MTASYAGQFESLLFVPHDGVLDAIRRVRASSSSDAARAYAESQVTTETSAHAAIPMAVVVQRMVDGDASGVAFGIDPVDGSDVVVVTAAYGLASGVVGGECTTDAWRVGRDGTIAARTIAEKDRMHVRAPGSGTIAVAVDAPLRARPALADDDVRAVASLARRIANAAGAPQDVEFTFAGGRLWALQARPVTAVAESRGARRDLGRQQHRRELRRHRRRADVLVRAPGVCRRVPRVLPPRRRPARDDRGERAHVRGAGRADRRSHDVRPRRLVPHARAAAGLSAQPPLDGRDDGRARGVAGRSRGRRSRAAAAADACATR